MFDAGTHAFAGFVVVNQHGTKAGPAEVIIKTGVVSAIGQTP